MPDAARQEATLIVRSLGPQIVQIKTHRLKPLPTEAAAAGQVQTARASYQYDPRTEATPQSEPAIVLTAVGNESAAAWVWDCEVRSQLAADGAADHVVSYRIQNAGSRQIRLTLPAGLLRRDVHGIWVNDKPAAARPSGEPIPAAGELAVDLPADLKFVTLVLRISTRGEPLGTFSRLRPPLPDIGLPVFARHWRLELPPGLCRPAATARIRRPARPHPSASAAACWAAWDEAKTNRPSTLCVAKTGNRRCRWRKTEDRPADPGTEAETAGWTQYPIDLADGTSTVIVVRRAAIDAAGWMLFLAVVGIGAWGLSGRPFALLTAGGRAGASRPAAARGDRGHFFPRPAGRPVLPAARTGAAAHDRGRRRRPPVAARRCPAP